MRGGYGAALWAMERYLQPSNPAMSERIGALRDATEREFGVLTAALNRALGPALLWASRRDAGRHPGGRRLEPRTFVERHGLLGL